MTGRDLSAAKMENSASAEEPTSLTLEHVSPATRLLEKRKQMQEVQDALDAQKAEYARKEEIFKRREENLRKKDLELQEALVLFNKFLKENEAKRRRADRRAEEEIKQKIQKEKEIENRKEKLRKLTDQLEHLKAEVAENEKYQTFLRRVQSENMGEYPDIEFILTRYHCLMDAHKDLMERQEQITGDHEEKRQSFVQYTKEQHNAILSFNNDIARYSKELELMQKKAGAVEEKVDSHVKAECARTLKLSQIIMAVDNLYERCKNSSKILNHTKNVELNNPSMNPNSTGNNKDKDKQQAFAEHVESQRRQTEARLDVIANYLIDYAAISHSSIK